MVWSVDTINLTKDIEASHHTRQEARKQMCEDTRTAMEKAQASLTQASTERAKQSKTDLRQRQAELKAVNSQVQAILEKAQADLTQAGAERAEQAKAGSRQRQIELKTMNAEVQATLGKAQADLTHASAERAEQTKVDLKQRRAITKNRIAVISTMLSRCRTERENASRAWQKLADSIYAKKGNPPSSTTVSPPAGKASGGAVSKSIIPGKTQLHESVFKFLASHPGGARMTELEKEFDVPRIHMARTIKGLLDSNKIEKRDKLYFASGAA